MQELESCISSPAHFCGASEVMIFLLSSKSNETKHPQVPLTALTLKTMSTAAGMQEWESAWGFKEADN